MPSNAPRAGVSMCAWVRAALADPAVVIAATDRIRTLLRWDPEHDGLDAMVFQALRWEERLSGG